MRYKALTLNQPWATYVADGKKVIETRTWKTTYRGDLVICSSAKKPVALGDEYPTGVAMCIVELYHVADMVLADESLAMCPIYENAKSWFFKNLRKIDVPMAVKGELGIYEIEFPFDLNRKIRR